MSDSNNILRLIQSDADTEKIKELIRKIKGNSKQYYDFLMKAIDCNKIEIVKFLFEEYPKKITPSFESSNKNYNKEIGNAILTSNSTRKQGDMKIIKILLKYPKVVDPSARNDAILQEASILGDLELVESLLKDPRVNPNMGLVEASKNGHIEIVKLLLNHPKINPNIKNNTAVTEALTNGRVDIAKLILSHKNNNLTKSQKSHIAQLIDGMKEKKDILKLLE